MNCFVVTGRKWRGHSPEAPGLKRIGYRRLLGDPEQAVRTCRVVVGKERRVFVVESVVLEEHPFRLLLHQRMTTYNARTSSSADHSRSLICTTGDDNNNNSNKIMNHGDRNADDDQVIFIDVDSLLFEHLLWLMYNDDSSFLDLNLTDIIDFYAQDS